MRQIPRIVALLTHNLDAWVVGSAADPEVKNPRDWDIVVPHHNWYKALMVMPKKDTIKPNSFGGWKFSDEDEGGVEIDMWPGEMGWIMQRPKIKWVWHPATDVRFRKTADPRKEEAGKMCDQLGNLLLNMSAGLLPEHLSEDELKLLEEAYGKHWFELLGYTEPEYVRPASSEKTGGA